MFWHNCTAKIFVNTKMLKAKSILFPFFLQRFKNLKRIISIVFQFKESGFVIIKYLIHLSTQFLLSKCYTYCKWSQMFFITFDFTLCSNIIYALCIEMYALEEKNFQFSLVRQWTLYILNKDGAGIFLAHNKVFFFLILYYMFII